MNYRVDRQLLDVTSRGHWRREIPVTPDPNADQPYPFAKVYGRPRYYWRSVRVPWLLWVLFS